MYFDFSSASRAPYLLDQAHATDQAESSLELEIILSASSTSTFYPQITTSSHFSSSHYDFRSCRPLLVRQSSSNLSCRGCKVILAAHVCTRQLLEVWLLIVVQTQGEALCPLRWSSFMGRRSDHSRTMDPPGT